MNSIWKAVPEFENYEMSICGKIRSLNYNQTGQIKELKQGKDKDGYFFAIPNKKGKRYRFRIHQLMAMTFLGFTPNGRKLVVDHKNNNKEDNSLENLQIITFRENVSKDKKRDLPTGVTFHKRSKRYLAQIRIGKQPRTLGLFSTPEEASSVYQAKLKEINVNKI